MPKNTNKKNIAHARLWTLRSYKPDAAVEDAVAVASAPEVASVASSEDDTNMDTDAAPSGADDSITTTNNNPSQEGASPDSDTSLLVGLTQDTAQDDSDSDEDLSDMDDSDDVGEPTLPFIEVPYKKYRDNCMIETAAFGDEKSSLKTKLQRLMACLAGIANPIRAPRVQYMLQEDKSSVPFFVFEIGETAERVELLSRAIKSTDGASSWRYYLHYIGHVRVDIYVH